jgi:serine/threonine-protein kinase
MATTTAPGTAQSGSVPTEGTILGGKYCVEGLIGGGGMGIVVAARSLEDGRPVAIKCLAREAIDNTELVERFSREAEAFSRIKSKHVVRILDVGTTDGGGPFLVLEYLEGMDAERHLAKQGPLPLGEVARYVTEVCEALGDAHAANIVHRDIKPSNLFLARQPDGRTIVKILDFGISKLTDEPLTQTRSVLGTAIYMSPEQLQSSGRVDHRTDIWALGVVLYELLTGRAPFRGADIQAIADSVMTNHPNPIRSVRPDLPPQIEDVIGKCLRTDPSERYASVEALAADLAPFVEREPTFTIVRRKRPVPEPLVSLATDLLEETDALEVWPQRQIIDGPRPVYSGSHEPRRKIDSAASLPASVVRRPSSALQYLSYFLGAAAVLAVGFGLNRTRMDKTRPTPAVTALPRPPNSPDLAPPRDETRDGGVK